MSFKVGKPKIAFLLLNQRVFKRSLFTSGQVVGIFNDKSPSNTDDSSSVKSMNLTQNNTTADDNEDHHLGKSYGYFKTETPISEVMKFKDHREFQKGIHSIDHLTPIQQAACLMKKYNISSAAITECNRVVGIVSERDFIHKVIANPEYSYNSDTVQGEDNMEKGKEGHKWTDLKVRDIATMGSNVAVALESDTVEYCLKTMKELNIRHIPVVNEEKQVTGMISLRDFITQIG